MIKVDGVIQVYEKYIQSLETELKMLLDSYKPNLVLVPRNEQDENLAMKYDCNFCQAKIGLHSEFKNPQMHNDGCTYIAALEVANDA